MATHDIGTSERWPTEAPGDRSGIGVFVVHDDVIYNTHVTYAGGVNGTQVLQPAALSCLGGRDQIGIRWRRHDQ
jgi:hypothetical protein